MKKILYFVVGVILSLGTTALAATHVFTDQDVFDDWYEESVMNMYEEGIILGYSDGSFGPSNNVNRAELAVILDRFDASVDESIENYFLGRIDDVVEQTLAFADSDYDYLTFLILAEAGLKELDEAPEVMSSSDWREIESADLPEGYSIYVDEVAESGNASYLYFEGEVCEADTCGEYKEQWYGPFSL
ncbi:MAG: hypothetical protein ACI9QC_000068 [Oceanicoccus sp.]|jgi:hypothetical protein